MDTDMWTHTHTHIVQCYLQTDMSILACLTKSQSIQLHGHSYSFITYIINISKV